MMADLCFWLSGFVAGITLVVWLRPRIDNTFGN
jgi:hypothetical protein